MKLVLPPNFCLRWIMILMVVFCFDSFGQTTETNFPPPKTARDFYNAGTRLLSAGKLTEAESRFVSALGEQDEHIQPQALYNLGHARFDEGVEFLKKGPDAQKVSDQGSLALAAADNAMTASQAAMAQNDMDKMVGAYIAGRGARRDVRAAQKAVEAAMEIYGNTLRKWQRAADDFKSAAELNRADTNAARNAETVDRGIAQLVDSLRQMQAMASALAGKKQELDQVLGQLKGRIPAPNAPPGAPGDDNEDDEGLQPDELTGQKEGPSREGEQTKIPLSPDQAGQILDGLSPDGARRLPMSDQQTGKPKEKNGRNW
jgi:hypothetical protein